MAEANKATYGRARGGGGFNRRGRMNRQDEDRMARQHYPLSMSDGNHVNGDDGRDKNRRKLNLQIENRKDHAGIKFVGLLADCEICCRQSDIFAVGECLHPICIECGIRLRVLCESRNCPKCRREVDTLYFVMNPGDWVSYKLPTEFVKRVDLEKYTIKITDDFIAQCYDNYVAHICIICERKGVKRTFATFPLLDQHVYMVHRFIFCKICVSHLHLFTRERRIYSESDLNRHENRGDPDDRSHRGHPKCLFCPKRFLDEEHQYKHLRQTHFFCQICDANGLNNLFFENHAKLLEHYRKRHIVCTEAECVSIGIAFSTDMELKLHMSTEHSARRQTINVDFQFSDRPGPSNRGVGRFRHNPRNLITPSEQKPEEASNGKSDSNTVASMRQTVGSAFSIRGRDFPPLGKLAQFGKKASAEVLSGDHPNNPTLLKSKGSDPVESFNSKIQQSTKTSSTLSCIIDDDEQFPSIHSSGQKKCVIEKEDPNDNKKVDNGLYADDTQSTLTAWARRPLSLSNIATALAKNDFPSLPTKKAVPNNLPVKSVWNKKKHNFAESESSVKIASYSHPINQTFKRNNLPVPDIWPKIMTPENWEELHDISHTESEPSKHGNSNERKEKKGKKSKDKSNVEVNTRNDFETDFPALKSSDTEIDSEKSPQSPTVIIPSIANILGIFKSRSRANPIKFTLGEPPNDSSSSSTQRKFEKDSDELKECSAPSLEEPPGFPQANSHPPGFGPPPGFENIVHSKKSSFDNSRNQ